MLASRLTPLGRTHRRPTPGMIRVLHAVGYQSLPGAPHTPTLRPRPGGEARLPSRQARRQTAEPLKHRLKKRRLRPLSTYAMLQIK